ncbi:Tyrosine recombinase XerC [compost metagenome]
MPIDPALEILIKEHWKRHGPFTGAISSFRRALVRSGVQLPKGQASHALRHTFASHFIQKGGNILTLQKILGHSSLAMTMRYAHLAPEHLAEAVRLSPLAGLDLAYSAHNRIAKTLS